MSEVKTEAPVAEANQGFRASFEASKAAVLAELEAGPAEAQGQDAPAAVEPSTEAAAVEAVAAEATEVDADAIEVDDDEPGALEAAIETAPAITDPDTAKRIANVQRAEKRSRELIAKERTELSELKASIERERLEIARQLDEVKAFSQLKAKARYAPAEVLAALGLTDDDFEPAARDLYTRSKAGAQDPRNREAAARMQAEREYRDKVGQLESKLQEMEQRNQQQAQQAQYQQAWQSYYSDVVKTATPDEAPLLSKALSKNPTKTQQALQNLATQICNEVGEWPDAADVVAVYEKNRRAELEELGIDLNTKAAPASTASPTKTLAPGAKASTPARAKKSRQEEREDVLAALESGRLE